MTFEEYETIVKKFPFLEFPTDTNSAYIGYEIIAIPKLDHSDETIKTVNVYNKVLTDDDDGFITDSYAHEIVETPEELYKSLLKLVVPYNTWKKSQRFALIKEL